MKDNVNLQDKINKFVKAFRDKVEPSWHPALLYKNFKTKKDDHYSAGYCGPTSIYLWKELSKAFPNEEFSLAMGRVYFDSQEWIRGKHVWVVWHQGFKTSVIIDATADQSAKINQKTIVENIDGLAKKGISYLAYRITRTLDDVDESPKRRAELLERSVK